MYLAIREMRHAKARYALIGTVMLLVTLLVLFVTGLAQGLAYDNASSIKNRAATHYILGPDSNHRLTRSQVNGEQGKEALRIVGEGNAEPFGVQMATVLASGEAKKLDITFLGVNPEGWMAPGLVEGSPLSEKGHVLVDRSLSEAGVRIGTILKDQASGTEWTVGGFVEKESFSHTPAVFVRMTDWPALQAANGSRLSSPEGFTAIAVKASKEQARELEAVLPKAEVIGASEAVAAIPGYKEEQGSLLMMIVFLYGISFLVLAVFFYVITIQKTSQFGILKAIGTRSAYLTGSVAQQVLILSAVSLVVSLVVVTFVQAVLPSSLPFELHPSAIAGTGVAFVILSLAGSLASVWKVSRVDALDAIGRGAA
ncbi:ABC transporter permease [Paenibacillus aurantius]|uniref:Putative hemin transport system permease protein HrtB n=1 Tax=Paenibacillus aurantius TaxID=2918900 RepID=A0AA96RG79_9BACL|nr:ABC transporter permease [Paenibacillus aurantius]WNQ09764.1 ABC transporter permease [Paenibacillus aurantius]